MKLLQVTNLYSPNHGGGAEAPYQLSKHLMESGHKVTVYCSDYKMVDDYYQAGVFTWAFPTKLVIANLHITPRMLTYDFRDFDVIHLHNARTFQNIVASHFAMKYQIPYVFQAHGGILPMFQKQGLKQVHDLVFGYKILNNAVAVIAGNQAEANEYMKMGVPEYKIIVIPPLYDTTEYDDLPKKEEFVLSRHVLFMGRIHKIKGLDFLLEAFAELDNKCTKLIIAGSDDGYKTELERNIASMGLKDRVIFVGMLRGQAKLRALVDADLLVQTSIYERGAGSPFEAVLCGTPIIVTSGTGAGDMVEQYDAGFTVKYGDVPELARLMNRILDNPATGKMKAKYASDLIRTQLSWKNGIRQYENLYEAVRRK